MADVRFEQATRIYPGTTRPRSTRSTCTSRTASSWCWSGPSGSGKTTALRMLAGLEEVDAGAIFIGDRDVTDLQPKKRDVSMVFQNYALYPYLTVAQNIGFPLKIARGEEGRARRARRGGRAAARAHGVPRAQAGPALRRPAPARRDGPRDRARAERLPDGRAALEPRREAARADARGHRRAAVRLRDHDRLRDARPVRGDDARPSRRRRCTTAGCSSSARRASSTTGRRTCSSPASSARRR